MMRVALLAIAIASLLAYAHAIARVFRRDVAMDPRMRALQVAGSVSAVVHVVALARAPHPVTVRAGIALVLYVAALVMFRAAVRATRQRPLTLAFTDDRPAFVLASGVYRYVRHPFYTAYSLTWLAGAVAAPGIATAATTTAMIATYAWAASLEERKFLCSEHAAAYRDYRRRAGAFWPRYRTLAGRC